MLLETGLSASVGVSYNKLLAKIASELFKPNGMAIIRPENVEKNIAHFGVEKILGVGKVTLKKMRSYDINTFGDLQLYSKLDLINMFGSFGANLYNYCRGIDHRCVTTSRIRKSVSVENTFAKDTADINYLTLALHDLFSELERRTVDYRSRVKGIFVKIKYFDFSITTIEAQREFSFLEYKDLFLHRIKSEKPIRLVGVGIKLRHPKSGEQLELFDYL